MTPAVEYRIVGTPYILDVEGMPSCCAVLSDDREKFACPECGNEWERVPEEVSRNFEEAVEDAREEARRRGWHTGDIHQTDGWFREDEGRRS